MLVATPLGGFREDAIGVLSFVLGEQRATGFVTSLETHIKAQAKIGAEQAIPKITAEVREEAKSAVKPYVIGSMIAAGIAALIGSFALYRSYRK